jgi:hypothetical protein
MRGYLLIIALLICPIAFAQQGNSLPMVQRKMQNINWLTGKWQGTAVLTGEDGTRQEVKHNLAFAPKLNNTVLVINESAVRGSDTLAQNIGLLGYNTAQSKYNLQAYTNEGVYIDAFVEALDKKFIWRIHISGHIVRYTATLNEKGQWHQIGEMSADEGKIWKPFFESTLTRLK